MSDTAPPEQRPEKVQISYIKNAHFRVIHVDGAVAGAGPTGLVVSLYSERLPIPQQQTFLVSGNKLGSEVEDARIVREGIVRELDVCAVMSIEVAEGLAKLLQKQIAILRQQAKNNANKE